MKIFLDTADTSVIKKSGRDPVEVYQEIKDIGVKDISMEVVGGFQEMVKEGKRLYDMFGDVCTVKVPCTSEGLFVCHELSKLNIRVNVTLIFSQTQAILSSKAGATYVSPFVGRVDDNSFGGICLVKDIVNVFKEHYTTTNVLAASVRNVRDVGRLFEHGAEIVTMPPAVFEKMYNHILTDKGLELFEADWNSVTHNP